METDPIVDKLDALKRSVDSLVLIEIAKSGATREQARKALGSLDNNAFSKISTLFKGPKGNK